jgi:hypothetical protein
VCHGLARELVGRKEGEVADIPPRAMSSGVRVVQERGQEVANVDGDEGATRARAGREAGEKLSMSGGIFIEAGGGAVRRRAWHGAAVDQSTTKAKPKTKAKKA